MKALWNDRFVFVPLLRIWLTPKVAIIKGMHMLFAVLAKAGQQINGRTKWNETKRNRGRRDSDRREKLTAINRRTNFDGNPCAVDDFLCSKMSIFCFKNPRTQHVFRFFFCLFFVKYIMQLNESPWEYHYWCAVIAAVHTAVLRLTFMRWWRDLRPQVKEKEYVSAKKYARTLLSVFMHTAQLFVSLVDRLLTR